MTKKSVSGTREWAATNVNCMKAKHLNPGDIFTVGRPDPESPVRVCKTNDKENGLRFGFPNKPGYWCYMGHLVDVELVEPDTARED